MTYNCLECGLVFDETMADFDETFEYICPICQSDEIIEENTSSTLDKINVKKT